MRHPLRAILVIGLIIAALPAVSQAQPIPPGYRGPPPRPMLRHPYHHRHRPYHRPVRPY